MSEDERRIRGLVQSWIDANKAGDLPALLELLTDDVVFMVPGRPPFGKAAFAANAKNMLGAAFDGSAEIVELEIFGGCAITRTRIEAALTLPGEPPQSFSGYSMSFLRKEANGRWRIARDANLVTPQAARGPGRGSNERDGI